MDFPGEGFPSPGYAAQADTFPWCVASNRQQAWPTSADEAAHQIRLWGNI